LSFFSPLWGLGTTYDVHLGLIGKHVVDFLLVLIKLCTLDVMAEALESGNLGQKMVVEGAFWTDADRCCCTREVAAGNA